jgi:hypothetical protein
VLGQLLVLLLQARGNEEGLAAVGGGGWAHGLWKKHHRNT